MHTENRTGSGSFYRTIGNLAGRRIPRLVRSLCPEYPFPWTFDHCFRFENPLRGHDDDPRYVAIYDFVSTDLSTAWSRVAESAIIPISFFAMPAAAWYRPFRATYRLERSIGRPGEKKKPSGLTILLSDGALRPAERMAATARYGLFYARVAIQPW